MAGDFYHGRCCIPGAGNTKASADAVAELATALKAKFGEEREDKFSEASKVVKHPEIIHPTRQDWRLTFRSWLIYAQHEYEKDLNQPQHRWILWRCHQGSMNELRSCTPSWLAFCATGQ